LSSRARPRDEQLLSVLRLERRHRVCLLAGEPKQLAARHDQLSVRAGGEHVGELRSCLDQMFEVVEEQEQRLVRDPLGEPVRGAERPRGDVEHE